MEKPTIGRIVHVVQDEQHLPAIVFRVPAGAPTELWVTVFGPFGPDTRSNVPQDEETKAEGTWHSPERE